MPDSWRFRLPPDGWYPFVPLGEFPGELILPDGSTEPITQVIDAAAVAAMLANWPEGHELLIDYEHFSHDSKKETVAAGWLRDLKRSPDGISSRNAWSAKGNADVTGGNYRFISPEFDDLEDLGDGRYRPHRIVGAGLTNRPALKTLKPLTNRAATTNNTNTKTMDYKALLIQALGLKPEATDEEITQAVAAKGTTANADPDRQDGAAPEDVAELQAENEQLKEENKALTEELVEKDLDENKAVITNRDKVKAALLANRAPTLELLKSIKTTPAVPPRVFNRGQATPPAAPVSDEEKATAEEKRAGAIRNRANEILEKNPRLTLAQAYQRAEGEIE